jgi:hypothetical protein
MSGQFAHPCWRSVASSPTAQSYSLQGNDCFFHLFAFFAKFCENFGDVQAAFILSQSAINATLGHYRFARFLCAEAGTGRAAHYPHPFLRQRHPSSAALRTGFS